MKELPVTRETLRTWLESQPAIVGTQRHNYSKGTLTGWLGHFKEDQSPLARFLSSQFGKPIMCYNREVRYAKDQSLWGQLCTLPAWLWEWDKAMPKGAFVTREEALSLLALQETPASHP